MSPSGSWKPSVLYWSFGALIAAVSVCFHFRHNIQSSMGTMWYLLLACVVAFGVGVIIFKVAEKCNTSSTKKTIEAIAAGVITAAPSLIGGILWPPFAQIVRLEQRHDPDMKYGNDEVVVQGQVLLLPFEAGQQFARISEGREATFSLPNSYKNKSARIRIIANRVAYDRTSPWRQYDLDAEYTLGKKAITVVMDKDPTFDELQHRIADAVKLLQQGVYGRARTNFERIEADAGGRNMLLIRLQARRYQADCLAGEQNWQDAIRVYDSVLSGSVLSGNIYKSSSVSTEYVHALVGKAEALLEQNRTGLPADAMCVLLSNTLQYIEDSSEWPIKLKSRMRDCAARWKERRCNEILSRCRSVLEEADSLKESCNYKNAKEQYRLAHDLISGKCTSSALRATALAGEADCLRYAMKLDAARPLYKEVMLLSSSDPDPDREFTRVCVRALRGLADIGTWDPRPNLNECTGLLREAKAKLGNKDKFDDEDKREEALIRIVQARVQQLQDKSPSDVRILLDNVKIGDAKLTPRDQAHLSWQYATCAMRERDYVQASEYYREGLDSISTNGYEVLAAMLSIGKADADIAQCRREKESKDKESRCTEAAIAMNTAIEGELELNPVMALKLELVRGRKDFFCGDPATAMETWKKARENLRRQRAEAESLTSAMYRDIQCELDLALGLGHLDEMEKCQNGNSDGDCTPNYMKNTRKRVEELIAELKEVEDGPDMFQKYLERQIQLLEQRLRP